MEGLEISHIKQVSRSEIPLVLDFTMEVIREVFPMFDPQIPPKDLQKLEETYLLPERAAFFAAYSKEGKVVGTIAARPYDGRIPQLMGCYDLTTTTEIVRCFVSSEFRRTGLGSKLVAKLTRFCKDVGYETLYLHTHQFLPGAVDFWQTQGFVITCVGNDPKWQTVHMDRSVSGQR
ncbi:GNAT family N-acetyltransferase [Ammoniphilus sp. YIM 78166]|uniref:GNAT family N-acetyltransferase n=1 Tax=Ammoniphilus sp. YIM 78166 TaxID=1644106 RepID=UPI0010700D71|nr:GNAT family N-acetyltransferase [Ammoniphilus sp. YIM 78166]